MQYKHDPFYRALVYGSLLIELQPFMTDSMEAMR